ncbi:MAG: ATP-binding protein [Myxococcota bacterium]
MTDDRSPTNKIYASDLGLYEGSNSAPPPANETLIGRARQRARLLDLLRSASTHGSYLITGYRGTGKTTFTDFVLGQYETEVYERFVRSKAGRRPLDLLLFACTIAAILTFFLLTSQLLEFWLSEFFSDSHEKEFPTALVILEWLVLFVVVATLLLPLYYSTRTLAIALAIDFERWTECWPRVLALVAFLAIIVVCAAGYVPAPWLAIEPLKVPWVAISICGTTAGVYRALSIAEKYRVDIDPLSPSASRRGLRFGIQPSWCQILLAFTVLVNVIVFTFTTSDNAIAISSFGFGTGLCVAALFRAHDTFWLSGLLPTPDGHSFRHWPGWHRLWNWPKLTIVTSVAITFLFIYASVHFSGDRGRFASWHLLTLTPVLVAVLFGVTRRIKHPAVTTIYRQSNNYPFVLKKSKTPIERGTSTPINISARLPSMAASAIGQSKATAKKAQCVPKTPWFHFNSSPQISLLLTGATISIATLLLLRPLYETYPYDYLWSAKTSQQWIVGMLVCLLVLAAFEYQWIIHPYAGARADNANEPLSGQTPRATSEQGNELNLQIRHRKMASATLFWASMSSWRPTIVVKSSLGCDTLEHGEVISMMMSELREQFRQNFASWRSGIGLISRLVWLTAVTTVALTVGEAVFYTEFETRALGGAFGKPLTDSRSEGVSPELPTGDLLTTTFFPRNDKGRPATDPVGYLALVWLATAFGFHFAGVKFGSSFYASTYRRLGKQLRHLSGPIKEQRNPGTVTFSPRLFRVTSPNTQIEYHRKAASPVEVEQALMNILNDFHRDHITLPGGLEISVPSPDITFIFDEVDKIQPLPRDKATTEDTERERTERTLRLLANLKGLMSSAPARFIFIGGRNLHDEWLADRTAQRPLLSTIFDAEIYIPSLLVDDIGKRMTDGTLAYVQAQLARSSKRARHWQQRHDIVFGHRNSVLPVYVQNPVVTPLSARTEAGADGTSNDFRVLEVGPREANEHSLPEKELWSEEFGREVIEYLTFRSRGGPKQLDALFEGFVRSAGRIIDDKRIRWGQFTGPHVLYFGDIDRFRVGMTSEVYRRLANRFEQRLAGRDDKAVRSLLQLVDFVTKFHRRAFSWSSLERMEELSHIHRIPDLRDMVTEFVEDWNGEYLHPILNGMYSFRFRSDMAAEVAYLSRASQAEMASYNFTLDETQRLKDQYRARIANSKGDDAHLQEFHSALGELCDFDQEFERARYHYGKAIDYLDEQHGTSAPEGENWRSAQRRFFQNRGAWCIARIRLMLQIGMTYERAKNHERAIGIYRDARTLGNRMSDAYLCGADPRVSAIDSLKHWRIIYLPLFAEAWLAEKSSVGVENSVSMVERELRALRKDLPFVKKGSEIPNENYLDPRQPEDTNFALAMSDVHAQAVDLYFWKGASGSIQTGYRQRALYHACLAMHDIRSFCWHRAMSSEKKLGAPLDSSGVLPRAISLRVERLLVAVSELWLSQLDPCEPEIWAGGTSQNASITVLLEWLRGIGSRQEWGRWNAAQLILEEVPCLQEKEGTFHRYDETSALAMEVMEQHGDASTMVRTGVRFAYSIYCLAAASEMQNGELAQALRPSVEVAKTTLGRCLRRILVAGSLVDGKEQWRSHRSMISVVVVWFLLELLAEEDTKSRDHVDTRATIRQWLVGQGIMQANAGKPNPRTVLEHMIDRFPYPMYYRMVAVRGLVDHATRRKAEQSPADLRYPRELLRLESLFDSPGHFSPMTVGLTIGGFVLSRMKSSRGLSDELESLANEALRKLRAGLGIVEGQREYHQLIAGLHCLDDDFNDRALHMEHALGIACYQRAKEMERQLVDAG